MSGGALQGGTWPGGTLAGYPLARSRRGYLGWVPPGQVFMGKGGGNLVGQQKEYLIHGGRYGSCVHAGGLSRFLKFQNNNNNPTNFNLSD